MAAYFFSLLPCCLCQAYITRKRYFYRLYCFFSL